MKVHKYYEPAIANHKIIQNLTSSYKHIDIVADIELKFVTINVYKWLYVILIFK